ncbi:MAG: phenylalanine--tRNA ligase subunit alpha [Nitrosopumilus sp. B06]|nr:MAG: phenylalanine--tRNA ligase subunit alpha [Nitrosopumilus sp. B06]
MSQVLHDIEKRIIASLQQNPSQTPGSLEESAGLSPDQIRRGIEWLKLKNLIDVEEMRTAMISLGKNGLEALSKGMPERRLLDLLRAGPKTLQDLQAELGPAFGSAMGHARKNNWITSSAGKMLFREAPSMLPGEAALKEIGNRRVRRDSVSGDVSALLKRPDFVTEDYDSVYTVTLSESGKSVKISDVSGAIDVEADAPLTYVARTHPLKDVINEVRETFVALGFSEIHGDVSQPSFWNFDALFTPQDHPARELQDTFYLDGIPAPAHATPAQTRKVALAHRRNWRYEWDIKESQRMVLRTHTTCVTIRHLAESNSGEERVFSLGRVFRNEKSSYKHLAEFHQIEGVVAGRDATLRDLMGIQREFYRRMGLPKIRFWPTFFPYTEPSLQTMVYNEKLGKWVELFGMGIFRPEVTRPLGISRPVLAWGGGIERIAMLKYSINDVREFYNNSLGWLRGPRCQ